MISQEEYQKRRQALAERMPEDAIALIPSAKEVLRNGDSHYRFRQNSDFYYLTGFQEPEALLMIKGGSGDSILFSRSNNPEEEQWTGKRLGQQGAIDQLGMKEAWPMTDLQQRLPEYLKDTTSLFFALGQNNALEKTIHEALNEVRRFIRRGVQVPKSFHDISDQLAEMRLFKSPSEIKLMQQAATISANAHKRAMRLCKTLDYEYQLEAEILYEFQRHGCRNPAYDPIVGSGANACILHYTDNNQALKPGSLVLIDAGCEMAGYAADISRTFPVNGKFTAEQKAIYELVLHAQKAGIEKAKPGIAWNEVQATIIDILTQGLCDLGILKGAVPDLIEQNAYRPFYMHNSGHWLGLDVHDCGAYKKNKQWRPFEPGMALTVEPGLYISAGMKGVDERWWNIGVRIEDDILVTAHGNDNLTAAVPVEINDIEALMCE